MFPSQVQSEIPYACLFVLQSCITYFDTLKLTTLAYTIFSSFTYVSILTYACSDHFSKIACPFNFFLFYKFQFNFFVKVDIKKLSVRICPRLFLLWITWSTEIKWHRWQWKISRFLQNIRDALNKKWRNQWKTLFFVQWCNFCFESCLHLVPAQPWIPKRVKN